MSKHARRPATSYGSWRGGRGYSRVLLIAAVALCGWAMYVHGTQAGQPPRLLAAVLVALYLAWLIAEAPITFRTTSQAPAEQKTLAPYATARVATAVSAVLGPLPWQHWSWPLLLPATAFVGGVGLRLTAIRALGRFYSHQVVRHPDHCVVTTGPYHFVRHPAYTGMMIAHIGFVAFFLNPVSVAAAAVLMVVITWRVLVEERVLWTVPGYSAYAAGRARLLPKVW
ncbi:methyltransferase family protein [Streptomyces chartreusis]